MKIALLALNQFREDKEANKTTYLLIIEESFKYNVELTVFPKMALTSFAQL